MPQDLNIQYNLSPSSQALNELNRLERAKSFGVGFRDNISPALGKISSSFSQFDRSLDASNARVLAFGASAGLVLGVQRAFANLVRETVSVQKAFQEINVIFGLTSKNLDAFGASLFNVSKETGQRFTLVAEAAKELSRQGLSATETLTRTRDALILTRQSGLDAADSVKAITAAINSFNRESLSSTEVINKLANVDAKFAVSSRDLADAISRTGSAAAEAGVSFNELIGLVTAAQQTSQRGGAVIAQALNSVFARISRPGVIEQLRELGVQIDASQSGVDKLRSLAEALKTSSTAQGNLIRDTAGGVRNLNVLSAVLDDLRNKYSTVARATDEARNSTDEAIQRNQELNKTYDALANRTLANIQQVSAQFGKLTIGPGLENVLGKINTILEGAISKNSDNAGEILGKGLLKGLGEFLGGPGLALVGAALFKLISRLAIESGTAFKTVLGLNKAAAQRAELEANINIILQRQPDLIALALSKEQGLLQVVREVNLALASRDKLAAATSAIVGRISSSNPKSRAVGFIPEMEEKMGAYAAGYTPGEVKQTNIPKLGKVYYNTAETVKKFPQFEQPAIMPPQSSKAGINYQKQFESTHGFNPYFAGGFLPGLEGYSQAVLYDTLTNSLLPNKYKNFQTARLAAERRNQAYGQYRFVARDRDEVNRDFYDRLSRNPNAQIMFPYGFNPYKNEGLIPNFAKKFQPSLQLGSLLGRGSYKDIYNVASFQPDLFGGLNIDPREVVAGILHRKNIKDFEKQEQLFKYGAPVPQIYGYEDVLAPTRYRNDYKKKNAAITDIDGYISQGLIPNYAISLKSRKGYAGKPLPGIFDFTDDETGSHLGFSKKPTQLEVRYVESKQKGDGYKLFSRLLDLSRKTKLPIYSDSLIEQWQRTIDYKDDVGALYQIFPQLRWRKDASNTKGKYYNVGDGVTHHFNSLDELENIVKNSSGGPSTRDEIYDLMTIANKGFVPNFSTLSDALLRESNAGISSSLIKIGKSPELQSIGNPLGLGVYNTKDEPGGLSQGISRVAAQGYNPKNAGVPNFASGYEQYYDSPFKDPFNRPNIRNVSPATASTLDQYKENFKSLAKNTSISLNDFVIQVRDITKVFALTELSAKKFERELTQSYNYYAKINKNTPQTPIGANLRQSEIARRTAEAAAKREGRPYSEEEKNARLANLRQANPPSLLPQVPSIYTEKPFSEQYGPAVGSSAEQFRYLRYIQNIKTKEEASQLVSAKQKEELRKSIFAPIVQNESLRGIQSPALQLAIAQNRTRLNALPGYTYSQYAQAAPSLNLARKQQEIFSDNPYSIPSLFNGGQLIERIQRGNPAKVSLFNRFQSKLQSNGLQNTALASSFILPIAAGAISEGIGDSTITRRGVGQLAQSTANIASYGALGASTGNPFVLGGALLGGSALEIPRIVKAFTDTIPDLEREIEKLTEKINQTNDGFSNIIQTNEKLSQYGRGELDLNPIQYGNLKVSRNEQINQLSLLFPKKSSDIREAALSGDVGKLNAVISPLVNLENQQKQLQQIQVLGQKIRPDNSFARFFNGKAKDEDIKNYITAQLSQRSANPENNSRIPNFLLENPKLIDQLESSYKTFDRGQVVAKKGVDYGNKYTTTTDDAVILGPKYREDIERLYIDKSRSLLEQSRKEITGFLSELEKSGKFEGVGDLIKQLNGLKKDDIETYKKVFGEIEKRFPIDQLRESLGRPDQIKNTIKRFNDFALSLDIFGEGLDSLSARLNIVNQSRIEDIQRNLGKQTGSIQNIADINSIKSSTNPFLSLSFQNGAYQKNALLTRDAQLKTARIGAENENQKSIIGVFSKLKDSLYGNLTNSNGANSTTLQGKFEQLLGKLLPNYDSGNARINLNKSKLGLYNNLEFPETSSTFGQTPGIFADPQKAIENLSGGQRSEFTKNVRSILSNTEKQLKNPDIEVGGVKRKILEQERKILQLYLDENLITDTKLQAELDKANKDLKDIEDKNRQDNTKQRTQIIETLASTYSDYVGNIDQLRENAAKTLQKAEKLGLTGRAYKRFVAYDFENNNISEVRKDYKSGLINSDIRRQAISSLAHSELEQNGKVSQNTFNNVLNSGFGYNQRDLNKDLLNDMEGLRDVLASIRPTAKDAFASIVDGSKSAGDAARQFGITIATNVLNKVSGFAFDSLFGNLFNNNTGKALGSIFGGKNSGGPIGYANGGMVLGGSGIGDDIPAMLSNGAYVIRKSSVNKYGKSALDGINHGRRFANGGINQILKNDFSITGRKLQAKGNFDVDPRLSVIGQTDENNPSNALKFGKEQDYINYLRTIKTYKEAKEQFGNAQIQRLIGAYFSGLIQLGGTGISQLRNKAVIKSGIDAGSGINGGPGIGISYANYAALGGHITSNGIRRFAQGGSVDSIPALLTGGEYVMSPDAVNRMGVGFMHRLNAGQVSPLRYATGGLVGKDIASTVTSSQDNNGWIQINNTLNKLVKVNEDIKNLFNNKDQNNNSVDKQNKKNTDSYLQPQVSITINMSDNGNSTQTKDTSGSADDKSIKEFSKLMADVAVNTIIQQQRPGGILQNTRK